MSELKDCFVIAPIGEPDSSTRKRSDQVLKHIITPAVEACGYKAVRADQIDKPGIITSQVIQRVVGDPLVIADLSETNPNVFYELAIRHAIRKPLVQIIQKGDRIPFDVAGTRTIQVDHHDLDSVEAAKKEIRDQIKSVEMAQDKMETPISVSLDLQIMRQSENPEERSLADLMAAVSDLRAGVQKIEAKLSSTTDNEIVGGIKNLTEMVSLFIKEISHGSGIFRRKRRFDPYFMMRFMEKTDIESRNPIEIPILLSMYREEYPWIYDIGIEAYRQAKNENWEGALETIRGLRHAMKFVADGPWPEDPTVNRKELIIITEELPILFERLFSRAREFNASKNEKRLY